MLDLLSTARIALAHMYAVTRLTCCLVCSTQQGELYGDRTAGFHGYSHLTGGFDGGQAEYARVPFGKFRVAIACIYRFIGCICWHQVSSADVVALCCSL